ncbi:hypothetical protein P7G51_00260 [Enterococcus asini]|nr:hypothetical protein [Enterococcus asini]MDT2755819.1 hypothetical protein [Enterococcus asini]
MFRNQQKFWLGFVLYILGGIMLIGGVLLIILHILGIPILL